MKILISPAKQMQLEESIPFLTTPLFLNEAKNIYETMQQMSVPQLKTLYKANDNITSLNYKRIHQYEYDQLLTPALFSYIGIQFKYMAPSILDDLSLVYLQDHLYVLSALYGVLRPFDGIIPYRLEANSSLSVNNKSIYAHYQLQMQKLFSNVDLIINLASDEYFQMVSPNLTPFTQVIHIKFCELINGKLKTKATDAKMARGRMVQYMATNQLKNPCLIKQFNELHFLFNEDVSDANTYIFIKQPK